MESIHNISKGFLTYDDRQDINAHQCLEEIIDLYSDYIASHLNTSKERLLEEYQKRYELEEMPTARFTCPQATDNLDVPPNYPPPLVEKFGERARQLFNKRAAATASNDNTTMAVAA